MAPLLPELASAKAKNTGGETSNGGGPGGGDSSSAGGGAGTGGGEPDGGGSGAGSSDNGSGVTRHPIKLRQTDEPPEEKDGLDTN